MRAHGYCLHCRRIKRINYNPAQAPSSVPYGECDDCLDRRAQKQRASGTSRRNPRKDTK